MLADKVIPVLLQRQLRGYPLRQESEEQEIFVGRLAAFLGRGRLGIDRSLRALIIAASSMSN